MEKPISITLDENDWGQVIDGLTCRAEQYEMTAKFHEDKRVDEFILEVRDAEEARNIASWYREIIHRILNQKK